MDSIGGRLKAAREARKLTLSEVTKETNISQIYIEALENEDFEKFPSETYATGFLRNYAEFLKLDAEEIIQSYKGFKIGESATPLEELTRPTGGFSFNMPAFSGVSGGAIQRNVIIGVVACIVIIGVIFLVRMASSGVSTTSDSTIEDMKKAFKESGGDAELENVLNLKFTDDRGYILASRGEAIQFLVDTKECFFLIKEISETGAEIQTHPDKTVSSLSVDVPVRLAYAGVPREVTVTLKATTGNRGKFLVELAGGAPADAGQAAEQPTEVVHQNADTTRVVAQDERNLKIIFEAEFLEKTYLELYLDGQQRNTGLMLPGRKERWEATSTIQAKIGNAGGVKVRINGKDFAFGGKGQVANKIIKWEKDPASPNVYNIVVKDWK